MSKKIESVELGAEGLESESERDGTETIDVRHEARGWIDAIESAVDRGAETAENVHRSVLDLPFEMLARTGVLEGGSENEGRLREVTGQTVGAIYDLVRDINHRVTSLATGLLEDREPHGRAE